MLLYIGDTYSTGVLVAGSTPPRPFLEPDALGTVCSGRW